jgi:hypothetical protein
MPKWVSGRQNFGYWKKTFASFKFFDMHLLRIPTGIHVQPHCDIVEYGRHYRLNISLKLPIYGGVVLGKSIFKTKRIMFFRPDINIHSMSTVEIGECLILSIGVVIPHKWSFK